MRDFSKVSPHLWRSKRFRSLGDEGRLLHMYLLTCEHQTSAGCLRLPDAYAAADLGWPVDKFHRATAEVEEAGLIVHDDETEEIFVTRWFKHNPPTNSKHRQGVDRIISEIDSDKVREAAESDLLAYVTAAPANDPGISKSHLADTGYMRARGNR